MQVKTILNRLHKFKSFVYRSVIWTGPTTAPQLEVEVVERANGKPICSECRFPRPGYDRLPKRRFEFVPLWGIKVFLVYAPRRVNCPSCGVCAEHMPCLAYAEMSGVVGGSPVHRPCSKESAIRFRSRSTSSTRA